MENEDLRAINDIDLAEMADQEMEIIKNSIPDDRSFEVVEEMIRRHREILAKDKKPSSWFEGKWYIREDFNEEPFEEKLDPYMSLSFMNYLRKIGNCFNTREEAKEMADKMKDILRVNYSRDSERD